MLSNSKPKRKSVPGRYVQDLRNLDYGSEWDYVLQTEPTQRLRLDNGNTGTGQAANQHQTLIGSGKPDLSGSAGTEVGAKVPATPTELEKLDQQAVLHDLQGCSGKMDFLPRWVHDNLSIAPSIICWTCNHLVEAGMEETYFG